MKKIDPKSKYLEIKPSLAISGSEFNEENPGNRYYYDARVGSLDAGLNVKAKVPLPPPYSTELYIPLIGTIGKIGVYINFDVGFGGTAELRYEKQVYENAFAMKNSNIGLKATGSITVGGEVAVLPGNTTVSATGKVYGKSAITGDLKFNFTQNKFQSKVYIDPLAFGVSGELFYRKKKVWSDKYETQLFNRIKIYDGKD